MGDEHELGLAGQRLLPDDRQDQQVVRGKAEAKKEADQGGELPDRKRFDEGSDLPAVESQGNQQE
jgi:hypothetical protein